MDYLTPLFLTVEADHTATAGPGLSYRKAVFSSLGHSALPSARAQACLGGGNAVAVILQDSIKFSWMTPQEAFLLKSAAVWPESLPCDETTWTRDTASTFLPFQLDFASTCDLAGLGGVVTASADARTIQRPALWPSQLASLWVTHCTVQTLFITSSYQAIPPCPRPPPHRQQKTKVQSANCPGRQLPCLLERVAPYRGRVLAVWLKHHRA